MEQDVLLGTYDSFNFDSYQLDLDRCSLTMSYSFSDDLKLKERLKFHFGPRMLSTDDRIALDRVARLLFLLAGVSYYKAFAPRHLRCRAFEIDATTAAFVERVYRNGLAEFAFRNGISLEGRAKLHVDTDTRGEPISLKLPRRTCVPIGGGKDSIVTLETLKIHQEPVVLFALGAASPIVATMQAAQLPYIQVTRELDPKLFDLNKAGALNGHVPITSIVSSIAVLSSIIFGFDTIAMSNEHSASEPNLRFHEQDVNHQYSKSFAFEEDMDAYVRANVSTDINYFSLLRPLSEVAIARIFAHFPNYFRIFRSCNTAFKYDPSKRSSNWCCNCPKCRFVFLTLAPFVEKNSLLGIFGCNLLNDAAQIIGYEELCGLSTYKPFECVGEIDESATLIMHLADDPNWASDKVIRSVQPKLKCRSTGHSFDSLFNLRRPHHVPDRFLSMLYVAK